MMQNSQDPWRPKYKQSLAQNFIFEFKSLIGRCFMSKYRKNFSHKYLNVGCGSSAYNGFVNADFYSGFKFWHKQRVYADWQVDLRFPLKCRDGLFDGIFTEHTLEHLCHDDVAALLSEFYRVTTAGSVIRIIVPDLEIVHENCCDPGDAAYAINVWDLTQNWAHLSVWNFGLLKAALEHAGFVDVKKQKFGIGRNVDLIKDSEHRKVESLYVEAVKP